MTIQNKIGSKIFKKQMVKDYETRHQNGST